MVIAVRGDDRKLIDRLEKLGYTVVDMDSQVDVEAILYNSKYQNGFLDELNELNLVDSMSGRGVLLLDIRDKDVYTIDSILKRRLYTHLF